MLTTPTTLRLAGTAADAVIEVLVCDAADATVVSSLWWRPVCAMLLRCPSAGTISGANGVCGSSRCLCIHYSVQCHNLIR